MNKTERIKVVLLGLIALGTTVTAAVAIEVAREGLSMEISLKEAEEIEAAYNAAMEDLGDD